MFVDQAKIYIESGNGGNGAVSFRREKYIPNGGPDGGDGGKGGNLIFQIDSGLNTLSDFRHKKHYKATSGEDGSKRNRHGKDGEDLIIRIPKGTLIKEFETGKIICDFASIGDKKILLYGGRGGKGNQHYATPTMQIPKYAQSGRSGTEITIILELKTIADVGLVGFPNVGKSTFLARVTNAKPKIANYHFTTLQPNLGVVDVSKEKSFVIADIPGLIEGASSGIGLGLEFLKHIERTRVLIHIVDAASLEGRNPVDDIEKINLELKKFNPDLLNRKQVIAANKIDVLQDDDNINNLKEYFEPKGIKVFPISAVTGKGVKELLYYTSELIDSIDMEPVVFEQEYFIDEISTKLDGEVKVGIDDDGFYTIEGTVIDKMLGFTNLESEKGLAFFQKFLKDKDIIKKLEELGIEEGDTVKIYDLQFDYYK